jgi:hypothetical protein
MQRSRQITGLEAARGSPSANEGPPMILTPLMGIEPPPPRLGRRIRRRATSADHVAREVDVLSELAG